jgi:alkanesulfonate monooxygenase SsuD/methylene tetrahydromethanopterin reductase-like flavin-dependent oxidoreductase (luciferase family)
LEGQRLKQQVEEHQVIPEMQGKTAHIQGRVQVPTRCVEKSQVSGQEARRRKQQQQHGQRVQLIENDQQEFDQENSWDQEEDQLTNEEQYSQYRKNRFQEEKQWQKMQQLFNQYPELTHKKLHQIVKSDEGKYQQVAEQLRELVQQKQVTSHLMPQIQSTLPTYFSEVAKQLYEAMQEQKEQKQQNKHHRTSMDQQSQEQQYRLDQLVGGNYQQYTDLMKRVYVYIVKEALKLNQEAPRRLANTPELIRKVWEKTQRQELTKTQIEKVDQILEQVQELLELDQTNQLIVDELVSEQLKTSSKQARRNLMRIIVTGLMMENSPIFEQHY